MAWPSATDYQEVIQNPNLCFSDPDLKAGNPTLNNMGLPKPVTGGFASVYQLNCAGHKYAVRCFLQYHPDMEHHYKVISEYLNKIHLPYMVDFQFLEQGVKIRGKWYPILKMEWIDGDLLNTYIQKNLMNLKAIENLAEKFLTLVANLSKNSIAHGDLHPGNIIVQDGNLKLIDYDGMYVPGLEGPSRELGHRNYQHPSRTNNDFGPYLDNFSIWTLYISLVAFSISPDLWHRIGAGEDFLLFRKEDFENPEVSFVFSILRGINNQRLITLINFFESCVYNSKLTEVPPLLHSLTPDLLSADTEFLPAEVESQAIGASWVWNHIEIQPFHLDVNTRFERTSVMILGVSTVILLYTVAMGLASALTTSVIAGGFIALLAVFYRRFRLLPSALKKWQLRSEVKNLARQQKQDERTIGELNKDVVRSNQEESQELAKISERQNENIRKEKAEIDTVDFELNRFLSNNNTQKQAVSQAEAKELSDQLAFLQNSFLYENLSRYAIRSSNISGIGPALKDRLIRSGIRTAADFVDIRIQTWGGSAEEARIVLRVGGSVHVDGIGPKKGQDLKLWRQRLDEKYRQQMPRSLPQDRVLAIKSKYQSRYQSLDKAEVDAKLKAKEKKESIFSRYRYIHRDLGKEMQDTRSRFSQYRNDIKRKIVDERKSLSKITWETAQKQQELSLYREITFKTYLRKIFTF